MSSPPTQVDEAAAATVPRPPWDLHEPARLARLWLVVVALGYVVVHVVLVGLDRPINWDESVYLTQVVADRPAVFFEPHRTRGVPLLVAPIAVFDPSMVVLRLYVVVLGAAGLFAAFATWIRTIGLAAPVAAALFAAHWVTVFYSVEVLPNLPAALLAVAIAGLVAQLVQDTAGSRTWLLVAALFATFALVRPPDAVLVGLGSAVAVAVLRPGALRRFVPAAAAGGLAGLAVWFVEGVARFGFSPLRTVTSAGQYSVEVERVSLLPLYLASLEDQLRCAGRCLRDYVDAGAPWQLPPIRTTVLLTTWVALVAVALVAGRDDRRTSLVALLPAVPIVAFYSYAGGVMNLRYLMPAVAVGIVASAVGARVLWAWSRQHPAGVALQGVLAVGVAATVVWQAGYGVDRLDSRGTRYRAAALAEGLEPHLDGSPCVVVTPVNYPQLQYWTRCPATVLELDGPYIQPPLGELGSYVDVRAEAEVGAQVFAIVRGEVPDDSPLRGWDALAFDDARYADDFTLLRRPPDAPVPPPPCPHDVGGVERDLARVLSDDC